jgi:hypothetical protein
MFLNPLPPPQQQQKQKPCRLWQTREVLHQCMVNPNISVRAALAEGDCLVDKAEVFAPLKLMYDSLVATGERLLRLFCVFGGWFAWLHGGFWMLHACIGRGLFACVRLHGS